MATEPKVWVFMPAGAQNGPSGRPQCEERLDLLKDRRTKKAMDIGTGVGEELKGPANAQKLGWTPDWISGMPYTVHMGNEDLSELFRAEQENDNDTQDRFWGTIEWLTRLQPLPLSVGLHGARLASPVVVLDDRRYNWRVPLADLFALQDWHGEIIQKIRARGLVPAIETVAPSQFVGPPLYGEDAVWVPMTYHEARIGAHPVDLCYLRDVYDCEIWVDLEHLFFGLNFFNQEANYAWMSEGLSKSPLQCRYGEVSNLAADGKPYSIAGLFDKDELVRRVGYAAELGWPPFSPSPMDMSRAIEMMSASHLHVGGSLAEVVDILPGEQPPPAEYLEGIEKVLAPYPGMLEETRGKRVGSHGSIYRTDKKLEGRLRVALANGGKTFLVETSGLTPKDCWYWAKEDALEFSFFELLAMFGKLLT